MVADAGEGWTRVEVLDPAFLAAIAPDAELGAVAADARARLVGMIDALTEDDTADAGVDDAAGA
ncbi:hypothetical protein [Nocardioides humi]|uniref:FXSXX-COOH protein n=1 Tax=Nocardioides humi TaxID=449461 RepID=A0ABN2ASX3_9ACTN|nr:hypothetical protein [Nocardioides humi]